MANIRAANVRSHLAREGLQLNAQPDPLNLTLRRVGRWTVLYLAKHQNGNARWMCRCDCGRLARVLAHKLRHGLSRQCSGCGLEDAGRQSTERARKERA